MYRQQRMTANFMQQLESMVRKLIESSNQSSKRKLEHNDDDDDVFNSKFNIMESDDDVFVDSTSMDDFDAVNPSWEPGLYGPVGCAYWAAKSSRSPSRILGDFLMKNSRDQQRDFNIQQTAAPTQTMRLSSTGSSRSSNGGGDSTGITGLGGVTSSLGDARGDKRQGKQESLGLNHGRLHVSNIPFRYRHEHLANLFAVFGPVLDAEVIFNERGSKGYGFVSFAKTSDALRAKMSLDKAHIDGRQIDVNFATPRRIDMQRLRSNK